MAVKIVCNFKFSASSASLGGRARVAVDFRAAVPKNIVVVQNQISIANPISGEGFGTNMKVAAIAFDHHSRVRLASTSGSRADVGYRRNKLSAERSKRHDGRTRRMGSDRMRRSGPVRTAYL
ncbi:hypothetical protein [Rhizobium sp. F40D2]|uniref:hypothetical protein n=1 Tax=Rhizobium sp. F40D2 TaxID=3453141 RepID=UPI003F2000DC